LRFSETLAFKRIEILTVELFSNLPDSDPPPYPLTEFMENFILAISRAENLKQLTILNMNESCFHEEEGPVPFLCLLS
jgi:hypothetical protein